MTPINRVGASAATLRAMTRSWAEPYKIKMVERLHMTTREERQVALRAAGWNTFLLRSKDVYIDLLTDSGTNAMSDVQWAGMMLGDEAYAGSENYYHLEDAVRRYYGYEHLVPTHQGRGAEHILSRILIKPGDVVPGNMYFTTTRAHQELAGGAFEDIIVDEAHDPTNLDPFKGNVDLGKLERLIGRVGPSRIPYVSVAATVNMAGGQPISLENLRAVRALCQHHGVRVILDATRAIENAWFIRQREAGQSERRLAEILRDMCACTDGCTMSGKKDLLVNIGGFLALNERAVFEEARNMVVLYEGLHTYGGLAGRGMEAMARGIEEAVDEAHMAARIGQVEYVGRRLIEAGVPVVQPLGGHAVFLDARRFLPHLQQTDYPAQALAGELYLESGLRTMERGVVSAGRDEHGHEHAPKLELVRLTFPRRVYTQAHCDVVVETVLDVFARAAAVKGLRMTYEPRYLRFFQARFEAKPSCVSTNDTRCARREHRSARLTFRYGARSSTAHDREAVAHGCLRAACESSLTRAQPALRGGVAQPHGPDAQPLTRDVTEHATHIIEAGTGSVSELQLRGVSRHTQDHMALSAVLPSPRDRPWPVIGSQHAAHRADRDPRGKAEQERRRARAGLVLVRESQARYDAGHLLLPGCDFRPPGRGGPLHRA